LGNPKSFNGFQSGGLHLVWHISGIFFKKGLCPNLSAERTFHSTLAISGPYRQKEKGIHRGPVKFWALLLIPFLPVLLWIPQASGNWFPLIDRLISDGFNEPVIRGLFSRAEAKFDPAPMSSKLEALIQNQTNKATPNSGYNPRKVYWSLVKERSLARARSYLREHRESLEKISSEYCVPKEIIVSILLVETRLGDLTGGRWAFNSLASMALCTDLETIQPHLPKNLIHPKNEEFAREICWQKANWAYSELKALILYAHFNGYDPLNLPGSIYGAIGLCQFMPTSALIYGVDADQDGRVDLFLKADAFYSIANYLREHGWSCQMDRASQHKVVYAYNHSDVYANTILAVADKLRDSPRKK
jgi:membrane-bound lytic murein transglycosylase B